MKKLLFIILFFVGIPILGNSQEIKTSCYYNGYWGEWRKHYSLKIENDNNGFILYNDGSHPSDYILKIKINNYQFPTKKERKEHSRSNVWYEYSGIVEYYVCEEYPTIVDVLKKYGFPCIKESDKSMYAPIAKRTTEALIKIAPYKVLPNCYNIYFDNIAVGISIDYGVYVYNKHLF